jgi:hypothetical protein
MDVTNTLHFSFVSRMKIEQSLASIFVFLVDHVAWKRGASLVRYVAPCSPGFTSTLNVS